ncbi:MAG: helix-turn-helix domain-containing protein [Alphaproteobacteria bacterium]|nr:helix-turn-helix domain-containing protein [Alphaproteobacteria bacterium]
MTSQIIHNLGHNLTFLRKSRGLTQNQLAQVSGIPRSTLSYIESGQGNPSLKMLITIASVLGVTLEELLAPPRPSCLLIKENQLKHQRRSQGQAIKVSLLPDPIPGLQFERITLKPKGLMLGTPHSKGTKEYFTCTQGCISIFVEGEDYTLNKGDVLAFPGDCKHSYNNLDSNESQGISIVVLQTG